MNAFARLSGVAALLLLAALAAPAAHAQADSTSVPPAPAAPEAPPLEAPAAAPAAGNAMNPNLSVIAWLQAYGGPSPTDRPAFNAREAEIGLQSVVDPYARADFFLSTSEAGGLDLEEGYITFTQLPAGLGLKAGKFRNKLGKFNQTHAGETPFADRPLAAQSFFGEEGLSSTGLSAAYMIPVPFYLNLEAEATSPPPAEQGGMFARTGQHDQLLYLGRLSTFVDLTDATNVNLSGTYANGPASPSAGLADTMGSFTGRARVFSGELTVRWKEPSRAIYRSLTWQTEWYRSRAVLETLPNSFGGAVWRSGMFSYVDYQFARRHHAGVRYDWLGGYMGGGNETGQLAYLTFTPSEFMLMSAQVRHVRTAAGTDEWNEFFKLTFNIGPHGAHPF